MKILSQAAYIITLFNVIYIPLSISAQPGGARGPLPVVVAPVEVIHDFGDTLEALGTARANESVQITANVTETVDELLFQDGQQVEKGRLLVRLRQNEELALLKAAQARLDERRAAFTRARGLEQQQALSTATLEERQALLSQIEGEVEVIRALIEDREIRAPFDGVLGLREISEGALVRPGDLITTIDDLSRIKVDFEAPSIFLPVLQSGQTIEAQTRAYPDRVYKGVVQTVSSRIDPSTRTVRVRAILENEEKLLRPGLLLTIRMTKNPRQALLIPEGAVLQQGSTSRVFRVVEDEKGPYAETAPVRLGTRVAGKVEVIEGLAEHDRVIVHGLMQVRERSPLRILGEQTESDQALSDFLENAPPAEKSS